MNTRKKVIIPTAVALVLVAGISVGCYANSTNGKDTAQTVEVHKAGAKLSLSEHPFIPGAVDWINLAIQRGGNTTYVAYSDLIGMKVIQELSNGKLVSETVKPDAYETIWDSDGTQVSMLYLVTKTMDGIEAKFGAGNPETRKELVSTLNQTPYEETEVPSYMDTDTITVNLEAPENLSDQRDFITTSECLEGLVGQGFSGFQQLVNTTGQDFYTIQVSEQDSSETQKTNEVVLLKDENEWGELLQAQLADYELFEKEYTIRYAPEEIENKSLSINDWIINNYDVTLRFRNKTTGEGFDFGIIMNNDQNIYSDNRSVVTFLTSESLNEEEFERLIKAVYWDGAETHTLTTGETGYGFPKDKADGKMEYYHLIYR